MSRGVARVDDRTYGTCTAHLTPITTGGTITSGSSTIVVNDRKAARLGDTVTADCGHTSEITSASSTVIGDEPPIARLDDTVGKGPYTATIISASSDVFADE
jgi:uncharacterized Zn-binding protein involved in type VI secretion